MSIDRGFGYALGVSRLGVAVCVVACAVLAAAAAPGLYLRDSGELTTASFTLGVAHETGFPLWCLLGKLCTFIPVGEVATRVNLLSAITGALAAYGAYRILVEIGGGDRASQ